MFVLTLNVRVFRGRFYYQLAEKVKLFQIGDLAPNNLEPEGSKLQLQYSEVELWLGSEFVGDSHIFYFYRMKFNPRKNLENLKLFITNYKKKVRFQSKLLVSKVEMIF